MKPTIILLVIFSIIGTYPAYAQHKSYAIKLDISGVEDGSPFYLVKNIGQELDTVQVSEIKNGKLMFKGTESIATEMYFIFKRGKEDYVTLMLSNDKFSVSGDIKDWPNLKKSGTRQQREYGLIKSELANALENMCQWDDTIKKYQSSDSVKAAWAWKNSKEAQNLYYDTVLPAIIARHPNSLYTPWVIMKYTQRNGIPMESSRKKQILESLGGVAKRGKYGQMLMEDIALQRKRELIREGAVIPDFKVVSPSGDTISIKQMAAQANYTLVDFWASWCKPCRALVPHLKEVYTQFKDLGFNIVAVSSDKKEVDWRKAIQEDGTPWKHGLQINQNADELFGISGIPSYLLMDRQGKLIAYSVFSPIPKFGPDIRGDQLIKTLTQLLK